MLAPLLAASFLVTACAAGGGSTTPPATSGTGPAVTPEPNAATEPTPVASADASLVNVPTACFGLVEDDCRRVASGVVALMPGDGPSVRYVQIGPFRCPTEQPCPATLVARPEGDVILESAGGAVAFHATADAASITAQPQEFFGVQLPPTTKPPLPAVAQPFTLGHCGLWSGIDLAGSWWDPVGFVDSGHPDAINAAEGTIVVTGADQAIFTSRGGLSVNLVRRNGDKVLPLCQ